MPACAIGVRCCYPRRREHQVIASRRSRITGISPCDGCAVRHFPCIDTQRRPRRAALLPDIGDVLYLLKSSIPAKVVDSIAGIDLPAHVDNFVQAAAPDNITNEDRTAIRRRREPRPTRGYFLHY